MTPEPHERVVFDAKTDVPLFSIKYNDEDGSNDLIECLSNQVFPKLQNRGTLNADPGVTGERTITEVADVIAFAPMRDESLPSYQDTLTGKPQQRRKFSFPDSFYLDRFLRVNHERAQKVIQNATVAEEEIRRLIKKKSEITKLDVSSLPLRLLTGDSLAVEQGRDEEHPILAVLLRECGTLSNRYRATSSYREFRS